MLRESHCASRLVGGVVRSIYAEACRVGGEFTAAQRHHGTGRSPRRLQLELGIPACIDHEFLTILRERSAVETSADRDVRESGGLE